MAGSRLAFVWVRVSAHIRVAGRVRQSSASRATCALPFQGSVRGTAFARPSARRGSSRLNRGTFRFRAALARAGCWRRIGLCSPRLIASR